MTSRAGTPLGQVHPLWAGTPPGQVHPPRAGTPPDRYTPGQVHPPPTVHAGLRSTGGRYASYWNAFLFVSK